MGNNLVFDLVQLMNQKKMTIATAESCTGGLLAKYITDQSGASRVFECGIVSYSGRIKNQMLGVSKETLEAFGEVSKQTAVEMASGVRKVAKSDIGVGITGIAGPTGGSKEKPVGLVYFAVDFLGECQGYRLELFDAASRSEVRERTTQAVFECIYNKLKDATE
jgi:nicotinamide-nucleotide amidase